jgi:hypothetical protein
VTRAASVALRALVDIRTCVNYRQTNPWNRTDGRWRIKAAAAPALFKHYANTHLSDLGMVPYKRLRSNRSTPDESVVHINVNQVRHTRTSSASSVQLCVSYSSNTPTLHYPFGSGAHCNNYYYCTGDRRTHAHTLVNSVTSGGHVGHAVTHVRQGHLRSRGRSPKV